MLKWKKGPVFIHSVDLNLSAATRENRVYIIDVNIRA